MPAIKLRDENLKPEIYGFILDKQKEFKTLKKRGVYSQEMTVIKIIEQLKEIEENKKS